MNHNEDLKRETKADNQRVFVDSQTGETGEVPNKFTLSKIQQTPISRQWIDQAGVVNPQSGRLDEEVKSVNKK